MKKQSTDKLANKLIEEVTRAKLFVQETINKHELEPYLDGDLINTRKVEYDEDITPEQVAILGAYTVLAQLLSNVELIKEGKEPKLKSKVKEIKVTKIDKGIASEIDASDLPKDIKDAIKKFAEGLEDDK